MSIIHAMVRGPPVSTFSGAALQITSDHYMHRRVHRRLKLQQWANHQGVTHQGRHLLDSLTKAKPLQQSLDALHPADAAVQQGPASRAEAHHA